GQLPDKLSSLSLFSPIQGRVSFRAKGLLAKYFLLSPADIYAPAATTPFSSQPWRPDTLRRHNSAPQVVIAQWL
ncbi:MAG TPA: hypothetical protein VFO87_02885, partial [Nitrospira sp.]|nr:hypothetical protein [Nitrospira sp.]